jgi:hypothetical protein
LWDEKTKLREINMQSTLAATPFTGDLLEYARAYAERDPEVAVMHIVEGHECTTVPFGVGEVDVREMRFVIAPTAALVASTEVSWVAIQIPVWMDITGDIAASLDAPKPHPLVVEGLALLIIDADGADFHVAEVHRPEEGPRLERWHLTEQGPSCDTNGVCS